MRRRDPRRTAIAIVGAGLSGRLLALNLLRADTPGIDVTLIDRGGVDSMGPAYSDDPHYLLNVPACRMGALHDDAAHFLAWARDGGAQAGPWDFLPRRMYKAYVLDLLAQAIRARTDGLQFTQLHGDATDVEAGQEGVAIHLASGEVLAADAAVLALGNFLPRHPPIENQQGLHSARYVRNPWAPGLLDSVQRDSTVCLIGTGQTTVDLVVALHRRAHEGRIVALSRRGVFPLAHRGFDAYPSFYHEIQRSPRILEILRAVRRHVAQAMALGLDERAVIDSLRPDTQTLWSELALEEKRRFLRHLFRHWEITRSRIPPESDRTVQAMRASGQLAVVAGRLRDLVETGAGLDVIYTERGSAQRKAEPAHVVINCVGPEFDYARVEDPLMKNLLGRGLIRPGPADIGLDATSYGAVIGRDGAASRVLYTIGSPMKGVLWEVIAVPEIRLQAHQLAQLLVRERSIRE